MRRGAPSEPSRGSPCLATQAWMVPLADVYACGARRPANAAEGAASASATKIAQDRIELVSIFTLTVELRPCWQGLARRVNDTSGHASGPGGYALVPWCRVWLRVAKSGKLCVRPTKIQSRQKLDGDPGPLPAARGTGSGTGRDPKRFSGEQIGSVPSGQRE